MGSDQWCVRLFGDAEGEGDRSSQPATTRSAPCRRLQHDSARSEDVDTDGEDHAADDVRHACMPQPWIRPGRRRRWKGRWTDGDVDDQVPS
jgi:hypothetical protein